MMMEFIDGSELDLPVFFLNLGGTWLMRVEKTCKEQKQKGTGVFERRETRDERRGQGT